MRFDDPGLIRFSFTRPGDDFSAILESFSIDIQAEAWTIGHHNMNSSTLSRTISRNYLPVLSVIVDLVIAPALLSWALPIIRRLDCSFFEVKDIVSSWDVISRLELEQLVGSSMESVKDELSSVQHTLAAINAETSVVG